MTACSAAFRAESFSPNHGISLRQRFGNSEVVWLISVELLERIARLFSVGFCPSGIAGKALDYSQGYLINAPFDLRSIMELSQSGLQQSNGLTVVSFKSQLNDLGFKGPARRSLCVYIRQQFSSFLQVTFGLINAGLCRHRIRIVWHNVQRSIIEL